MTFDRITILERQLDRARKENELLETLIETRSRSLFMAKEELREAAGFFSGVLATLQSAVFVTDLKGTVRRVNEAGVRLFRASSQDEVIGQDLRSRLSTAESPEAIDLATLLGEHDELLLHGDDDERRHVLCAASEMRSKRGERTAFVVVATDVSERKRLEVELRHSQKLESVGQLAAGIAHEINTPVQFIGDSLAFLSEAFEDVERLSPAVDDLRDAAEKAGIGEEARAEILEVEEEIDVDFLREEIPAALKRAADGVQRVARIVRAMKEFAHPGSEELVPVDLNRAIETTLTVARGEFKYVAEIETEFTDLQPVRCYEGDINQVILNIVVNAAHAIKDRLATSLESGQIRIATREEGHMVAIEIEDNGTGIPDRVRERIFEPFFTTKGVGRGTGQGLALAHKVIVERHGGEIQIDTEEGRGTKFTLRIPFDPMEIHQQEGQNAAA